MALLFILVAAVNLLGWAGHLQDMAFFHGRVLSVGKTTGAGSDEWKAEVKVVSTNKNLFPDVVYVHFKAASLKTSW
jgi:hypothetical protein